MILFSLEFELPLFSLVFLILLLFIYCFKDRIDIIENKCFSYILIFSFIEIFLSTVVHYICATTAFDNLIQYYYHFINFANKIVTTSFVGIFTYLLFYILIISFSGIRDNIKKLEKYPKIFIVFFFVLTLFTKVELVSFENVTNVKGSTPLLGYFFLALLLVASFVISVIKIKNIDRRYYAIFVIIPLMVISYFITIFIPEMIIYDVIIVLFCYIMYFTMENPDMKLLEELHKSKEISDNANEEKTLFLYNMTQEIRDITGKIDDDADIILESKELDITHDKARDIKANTSKFTSMTNELFDVSKVDSANIKTYSNKYNIKNVLKQVINIYTDECKKRELKFITNIDHDIPELLYGDSINLKEALNIVLDNSVEYTDKGYIDFSVNAIIKNDICRLVMTVDDSGPGIKSGDINKIKLDDASLGIANKLITLMNGTMIISSDYGVGTKVKLILDQKIAVEEKTEVSKYESTLDNIDILVVDDSEAGLKIIGKLLKGTNIKIDNAITGKECIDKIRTSKYDLILLDEELTSISGIDLIKKIKEIRNFNVPIVLLTKDNSYEYNEEYIKLGFSDYALKPMKKDYLLNKINNNIKKVKK